MSSWRKLIGSAMPMRENRPVKVSNNLNGQLALVIINMSLPDWHASYGNLLLPALLCGLFYIRIKNTDGSGNILCFLASP
jgi:hypothetical protein